MQNAELTTDWHRFSQINTDEDFIRGERPFYSVILSVASETKRSRRIYCSRKARKVKNARKEEKNIYG